MSSEVSIKVKWGKEVFDVNVDLESTGAILKAQLQSITSVPSDRQKIMGATILDDKALGASGITNGKTLMLVGSADEALVASNKEKQKWAEDRKEVAQGKPRGLTNVGNTCYLNSSLQVLRQVPELNRLSTTGGVVGQFQRLMKELSVDSTQPIQPFPFLMAFHSSYPQFAQTDGQGRPMQQDAEEAMSSVLQSMRQGCQSNPEEAAIFNKLFTITTEDSWSCTESEAEPPQLNTTQLLMLPCNLGEGVMNVEGGFQANMDATIVKHSNVLGRDAVWKCKKTITQLPEYLVVHLVRFGWRSDTSMKAKVLKPITFPFVLDTYMLCSDAIKKQLDPEREKVKVIRDELAKNRKEKKGRPDVPTIVDAEKLPPPPPPPAALSALELGNKTGYYELCGVVSHKGRTGDGGHYVGWVKDSKGNWVIVDDENSAFVTEEEIVRLKGVGEAHIAYLLLYRSKNPTTGARAMPL